MRSNPNSIRLLMRLIFALLPIWPIGGIAHAQSSEVPSALSLEALGNAIYRLAYASSDEITLANGSSVRASGAIDEERITLTGYVAYGDVTGDDVMDAAVVIEIDTGGTAVFYDLALMVEDNGQPANVATTSLGDRVVLQDLQIHDGQLVVEMITHGPGDADCCPTNERRIVYALADGELSIIAEEALAQADEAGAFAPDADPTVATLTLGGTNDFWLDPTLVSLHSGARTGEGVDASTLGRGCTGIINERPEVVLNWTADERVEKLRIFFLSMGDPTLVVVTPAGDILCSDDLNPLVLDPSLVIDAPATGRYAIYLGSFAGKTATPGFLAVTGLNLSPATLDIAQLFPREIHPGAVGEPKSIDVLQIEETSATTPTVPLTETTMPITATLVAGGDLGAYEIELGNDLCTGFITAAPSYGFDWQGEAGQLVIFFEGEADTTLVVRDPTGAFECDDDAAGAKNLNPYLDLTPVEGHYNVWVGSFSPTALVTGTLTLSTNMELQPAVLESSE